MCILTAQGIEYYGKHLDRCSRAGRISPLLRRAEWQLWAMNEETSQKVIKQKDLIQRLDQLSKDTKRVSSNLNSLETGELDRESPFKKILTNLFLEMLKIYLA